MLKGFSILALVAICSAEQNHFNNFGKGVLEEDFCESLLKAGHWPGRCHLKAFIFLALKDTLFNAAKPFRQFW